MFRFYSSPSRLVLSDFINTVIYFLLCRFRLVAKVMSAFLAAQMPSDASLRLQPDAPGFITAGSPSSPKTPTPCSPSQQARQTLATLESLRTNKLYSVYKQTIETSIDCVISPSLSFRDSSVQLSRLTSSLFPEINYLEVVRRLVA